MNKKTINNSSAITIEGNNNSGKFDSIIDMITFAKFRSTTTVISVLRLSGVIGKVGMGKNGLTIEQLNDNIETAFSKPKLSAVCLIINSPGGSPVQSELIAGKIRRLAKEKSVPVFAFVEDVAASGGYWLALAADEIYVSQNSIIGSIGVIAAGFGFQEAIKKMGVDRRVYTQGKNKSILDPFSPEKKEDVQIVLNIQKIVHKNFIDYVKSRRKGKLIQSDEILFNGEFWAGKTAEDFGLVDGIDNIDNFLKNKFGDKIKIEYVKAKESWFKKRFFSTKINSEEIVEALHSKLQDEVISSKFKIF